MLPCGGGYEALLTASVLSIEARLADCARAYAEVIFSPHNETTPNARMEEAEMEAAYKVGGDESVSWAGRVRSGGRVRVDRIR